MSFKLFFGFGLIGFLFISFIRIGNGILRFQTNDNTRLTNLDKAEIEEFINLQRQLGDSVWPGFGRTDIPVILFNEGWAFLTGYKDPPDGWKKVPQMNKRGKKWELVPDDKILGQGYYRQPLDSNIIPEAFTVKVGEKWIASMTTIEWTRTKLVTDIKKNMPSAQKDTSLLKMMVSIMGGNTDKHISMIIHESFHAFQAVEDFTRLKESESTFKQGNQYPWNNETFNKAWKEELTLLVKAYETKNEKEAKQIILEYLQKRKQRFDVHKLAPEIIRFEQLKEWEEGLAKYIELILWKSANTSSTYAPVSDLRDEPSFDHYKKFNQTWSQELMNCRMQPQGDDTRFYYSGMMQAFLLDRFYPDWKKKVFKGDIFLDTLLAKIGA